MNHTKLKNNGLTLDKLFLKTFHYNNGFLIDNAKRISYGDFYDTIISIAGKIHKDFGENKVVSVMDWNSMNFASLLYAIPISGNIIHPVDVRQPVEQIITSMREAGTRYIIYSNDFKNLVYSLKNSDLIPEENMKSINEIIDEHHNIKSDMELPKLDENRIASILFSSGTTGKPKGVKYKHRDIILTIWAMETNLSAFPGPSRLTSLDTVFSLIPFFHLWSWGTLYISTLIGSNYVIGGRFDPTTTLDMIKRNNVTWMSMVPTMFNALISYNNNSLDRMKILIGGSSVPSGILNFATAHEIEMAGIYGFTDGLAAGIGTSNIPGDLMRKNADAVNVITPLVFTDFDIYGENNELKFKSPWIPDSYFNIDSENAYKDGWFYPGDAAEFTKDGKIKIIDRIKDLIKSGGEFIPSALLEYHISEIDNIMDVAVIGVHDDKWGERPIAIYRTRDNIKLSNEIMVSHLKNLVKKGIIKEWWIPDSFIYMDKIPITGTGKIDKKSLRAMFEENIKKS